MCLVIFDTETTGFAQNHIVELAAVIYTLSGESYTWYSRCRPSSPIEDGAAQVHGITNFMVQDERPDTEVVAEFWSDVLSLVEPGNHLVIGGHNSAFDVRAIRKYVSVSDNIPVLCTMKLGRLYSPEAQNHKLTTLHAHLGLTGDYKAHSAMDDVYMSFDILQHYMRTTGLGYLDLALAQRKPVLLKTMPFGKHKGTSMQTVPGSYINYMLGFDDLDPDVRFTFQQETMRRGL